MIFLDRHPPRHVYALLLFAFAFVLRPVHAANDPAFHSTIRTVQQKVVKIYGAGGVRGLEAYQTGVLISPEGHVLTVLSYVLDTDDLAVILDDGHKYQAELLGSDPVQELAVLKLAVEGDSLPYFNLEDAPRAAVGDRVLAASNLFNIAAGDEPVSILQGIVTAIAPLDARRGSFQSKSRGDIYIVDAAANNPGAAGGALVDWQGRFLGLLGKELRSRATGAWVHYALPAEQIVDTVENLREGRSTRSDDSPAAAPVEPLALADLGIVLIPDVLPRTPPYIDSVFADSAADRAKLRPDDLVVFIAGESTPSCAAAAEAIARHERFDEVRISVLRNGELVEVTLAAEDKASESLEDETKE